MLELNIMSILEDVLGEERAKKAVAIVAYYLQCDGNTTLAAFRRFMEENLSFVMEPFDDRAVDEEFQKTDITVLENFERQWLQETLDKKDLIYYDLTSLSTTSHTLDGAAFDYNRDNEDLNLVNIGLICTSSTKRPLYISIDDTAVSDTANLDAAVRRAQDLGLTDDFDIIYDGGFDTGKIISTASKGHCIMTSCSYKKYPSVLKAVLDNRQALHSNCEDLVVINDTIISSIRTPFDINGVKGDLLIFLDLEKRNLQVKNVIREKDMREQELLQMRDFPDKPIKYEKYFNLCRCKGASYFKYELCKEKLHNELNLCGISTFFSTRECTDNLRCLSDYRAKDTVAKMFDCFKNDVLDGHPHVHSSKALQGKAFYLFIALILYKEFELRFKDLMAKRKITTQECFKELQRIQIFQEHGRLRPDMALSSLHRDLLNAVPIPDMPDIK